LGKTTKAPSKDGDSKIIAGAQTAHAHANSLAALIGLQNEEQTIDTPVSVNSASNANSADRPTSSSINSAANATAAGAPTPTASNDPLAFTMSVTAESDSVTPAASSTSAGTEQAVIAGASLQHSDPTAITAAGPTPTPATEHSVAEQTNFIASDATPAPVSHGSDSAEASSATQHAAPIEPESETNTSQGTTVHNVQVQVGTNPNERVDVRMTTQGGDLRLSVRSANADVTRALQEHMPELTNRLEQQHYHTEVWIPRSSESAASNGSNARGFQSSNGDGSGQGQSGNRQNGQQQNDPEWLDEIAPQRGFKETYTSTWLQ
jgi:flagellar hook-length control protein FliK